MPGRVEGHSIQGIRAFVGHSFLEQDRNLSRSFTDHFETLSKSSSGGFTWDHAEEAAALPLSQKVLEKVEGKNLFIGICTRKERVFDATKVTTNWFGCRKFDEEDFHGRRLIGSSRKLDSR